MVDTHIDDREFVLTVTCPDRPGIVHAVSAFLFEHGVDIVQSQQYDDRDEHRFFMRVHIETLDPDIGSEELTRDFGRVAEAFAMTWRLVPVAARTPTLIMVSRYGHCLNDLLFRARAGALPIDVVGIVSNHPDFAGLAAAHGVEFHHMPVDGTEDGGRERAEARLLDLIDRRGVGLVVLARYMRILSADLCKRLDGRMINIHHSFLPSFKGARPYQQAYERGVKLIGATAHYVTAELDEGPIIEQDVARVDHAVDAGQFAAIGRDVEAQVLARAVRWHTEHRVLLNGHRTVVFR